MTKEGEGRDELELELSPGRLEAVLLVDLPSESLMF